MESGTECRMISLGAVKKLIHAPAAVNTGKATIQKINLVERSGSIFSTRKVSEFLTGSISKTQMIVYVSPTNRNL